MTAQERFHQWRQRISSLDISADYQDLLVLLREVSDLNSITQQAEKEHA